MSTELESWAKKYEELTNNDDTIKAMSKYYTCSFMFDMEKAKAVLRISLRRLIRPGRPIPSGLVWPDPTRRPNPVRFGLARSNPDAKSRPVFFLFFFGF